MGKYASEVVKLMQSWVGIKEGSNGHKTILDIYNSQKPLPRGYKMTMKDAWCAATTTAAAVKLEYTDIIPCECSCTKLIEKAKTMGIWVEDESVTPKPGWLVLYDWNDKGSGDCKGGPEHIGVVEKVENGKITFIEGNHDGADTDRTDGVERRVLAVNARYLRGYIAPKYDAEPATNTKPAASNASTVKVDLDQLKKGAKGEQVKALQRMLYAMGYELGNNNPIDGNFGPKTDTAVRAYQKKKSLTVDGIVGAKTWNKLLKG